MKKVTLRNDVMLPEVARLIAEGEDVVIRTKGSSMLPFIRGDRDDVVLSKPLDLKVLDIVLAEVAKGRFVLHRIIEIKGDTIILMGDGNLKGQEKCRRDDVLAVALSVLKDSRAKDCRSRSHRIKARLWLRMRPVRRYILAIYRRICK